jgi:hypothetical protein
VYDKRKTELSLSYRLLDLVHNIESLDEMSGFDVTLTIVLKIALRKRLVYWKKLKKGTNFQKLAPFVF